MNSTIRLYYKSCMTDTHVREYTVRQNGVGFLPKHVLFYFQQDKIRSPFVQSIIRIIWKYNIV